MLLSGLVAMAKNELIPASLTSSHSEYYVVRKSRSKRSGRIANMASCTSAVSRRRACREKSRFMSQAGVDMLLEYADTQVQA